MSEAERVPIEKIWLDGDVFNKDIDIKDSQKRLNETVITLYCYYI